MNLRDECGRAGAPDDRAPRQRARRRRAEHRAAGRRDQILVQLPGVTDVERAKEIIGSPGLLELKIVEGAPSPSKEALMVNGQVPQGMDIVPGAGGAARRHVDGLLPGEEGRGGHRPGSAQRARIGGREQPAGGQLHAEQRRRTQVRQGQRREHRPPARDHPRRPRAVGADARDAGSDSKAASPAASRRKKCRTCRLILRSGALPAKLDYLEEQTIGPSLGADSIRSGVIASVGRPAAGHRCSCWSTTSCRA